MAELQLVNITKRFGKEVTALESVSLEVGDGQLLAIVGPSGCGKTTLLRIVAGLESATEGQVLIDGQDITQRPPHRRHLGMVFQGENLFPHLNVMENLAITLQMRKISSSEIQQRVARCIDQLDLGGLTERLPAELSGGQRQRVALGRLLVDQPRVALLDEPLSSLDAGRRDELRRAILLIKRHASLTMVYVTHDQAEAMVLGDELAVMESGRIVQRGNPRHVYEHPGNEVVARLLGTPAMNLWPGRVEHGFVHWPGVKLPWMDRGPTGDVLVGIRAEHLSCRSRSAEDTMGQAWRGTVVDLEFLGWEQRIRVRVDGAEVVCRTLGVTTEWRPGEAVVLTFDTRHLHLFAPPF